MKKIILPLIIFGAFINSKAQAPKWGQTVWETITPYKNVSYSDLTQTDKNIVRGYNIRFPKPKAGNTLYWLGSYEVVFYMHGSHSSVDSSAINMFTKLADKADAEGFVLVTPQACYNLFDGTKVNPASENGPFTQQQAIKENLCWGVASTSSSTVKKPLQ